MSDLFQEVEEEYRREQMAKLWAKYRIPIVGGVAALVVAVAGFEGWRYWRADQLEKSSRGFEAIGSLISSPGNEQKAAEELAKLVDGGTSGYRLAARFQEAALRAEMGDVKRAVTLYDSIASSTSDPLFRDYAHLRSAILTAEAAKYEDLKARLEPITKDDNAWRPLALEILAYVSWRAGKNDEALKLYAEVGKVPGVPDGSKRRALEMSALIGAGLKPADAKPQATPTDSLLPPTGGPLLPQLTPRAPAPAQPDPEQPSSLLGPPEQPPTP